MSTIRKIENIELPTMELDGEVVLADDQTLLNLGLHRLNGTYFDCDDSAPECGLILTSGDDRYEKLSPEDASAVLFTQVERDIDGELQLLLVRDTEVLPTDTVISQNVIPHRFAAEVGRRYITKREFKKRLGGQIAAAIRNSTDPIVQDFYEEMLLADGAVDLLDPTVNQGLHYFEMIGIIPTGQVDKILEII